ncbi:MAG: hypothetical protein M1546_04325 [Chloroflexi bacterium]|nr:hypothetical protein [Chloroflexota bacterium]
MVRETILQELPAESSALPADDLAQLLSDNSLEVRTLVIDRLLNTTPATRLFPGVLEHHIPRERDRMLRLRLLSLCAQSGGIQRLVVMSRMLPTRNGLEILQLLHGRQDRLSWAALMPLTTAGDPRIDMMVTKSIEPHDAVFAWPWLVKMVARASRVSKVRNRAEAEIEYAVDDCASRAMTLLIDATSQLGPELAGDVTHREVQSVTLRLEKGIEELEFYSEEEPDDESYVQEINQYRMLQDRLRKLSKED